MKMEMAATTSFLCIHSVRRLCDKENNKWRVEKDEVLWKTKVKKANFSKERIQIRVFLEEVLQLTERGNRRWYCGEGQSEQEVSIDIVGIFKFPRTYSKCNFFNYFLKLILSVEILCGFQMSQFLWKASS
jgi:hypothetical protein